MEALAEPDHKLSGGRVGFVLPALLAFLPSAISLFTQYKEGAGPPPLDSPLGSLQASPFEMLQEQSSGLAQGLLGKEPTDWTCDP